MSTPSNASASFQRRYVLDRIGDRFVFSDLITGCLRECRALTEVLAELVRSRRTECSLSVSSSTHDSSELSSRSCDCMHSWKLVCICDVRDWLASKASNASSLHLYSCISCTIVGIAVRTVRWMAVAMNIELTQMAAELSVCAAAHHF